MGSLSEDALEILRKYDTVLIVDDSGSMRGERWRQAGQALAELADVAAQYDTDGIEIRFLNSSKKGKGLKSAQDVEEIFNSVIPYGPTPLGKKLKKLLKVYLKRQSKSPDLKPVNYIVLTDGVPSDEVETVIVNAAKIMDGRNMPLTQIGIQFVQVGQDADATRYLEGLDNNLRVMHAIRDIVDTTHPGEKLDIIKILIGGVNHRVDNKGSAVVQQ